MSATPPSSQPTPTGYTQTAPRSQQNGLALASLILGIVGFLINPLFIASILALIFGIIALRRSPALGRRNMAIVGIILAIVGAIVSTTIFLGLLSAVSMRTAQTINQPATLASAEASEATSAEAETPRPDQAPSREPTASEAAIPSAEPSETSDDAIPAEYISALAQAQSYSDNLHLSKAGLYDQLISDYGGQFPKKAAQYAIDHVDANYDQNALAQAKSYQENLHLSRAGIHDQLTSSYGGKFTQKQADYALKHLDD